MFSDTFFDGARQKEYRYVVLNSLPNSNSGVWTEKLFLPHSLFVFISTEIPGDPQIDVELYTYTNFFNPFFIIWL